MFIGRDIHDSRATDFAEKNSVSNIGNTSGFVASYIKNFSENWKDITNGYIILDVAEKGLWFYFNSFDTEKSGTLDLF